MSSKHAINFKTVTGVPDGETQTKIFNVMVIPGVDVTYTLGTPYARWLAVYTYSLVANTATVGDINDTVITDFDPVSIISTRTFVSPRIQSTSWIAAPFISTMGFAQVDKFYASRTGDPISATDANSPVRFDGGLACAGRIWASNITLDNNLNVGGTNQSTSATTGAIVCAGGLGVAKNVHIAGTIMCGTSTDTSRIFSGLYGTGGVIAFGASNSANNQAELAFNYIAAGSSSNSLALGLWGGPVMTMLGTGQTTFVGDITMQKLVSNNATTSTSSTTGSVLVSGGIAISNTTEAINSTNGGSFTTAGGMAIAKSLFVGGNTIIASNLSVNGATTTIAGNLNVNGTQTSLTNLQASDTVITGFLSSNNNTNTTGLGSGAITTTGGAAISKDVHIGGALMLGTSTDNSRVISSRINGVNSTIAWGSDNNANNQAELIFNYVGAGYTANNLGLGFWGVQCMNIRADRVCNFLGTGQVANGTASVVIAGGVSIGRALQYESQSRKIVFLSSGSQLITPAICSNTYIYIQTPTGGTLTMDSATNFIAHAGGNTAPNPNPNNFEYGCILENRSGGLVNLVGFGVYTSISNTACVKFTIHLSLASGTVLVGGITLQ